MFSVLCHHHGLMGTIFFQIVEPQTVMIGELIVYTCVLYRNLESDRNKRGSLSIKILHVDVLGSCNHTD